MIELHPEILTKDGKPLFAVLPYEEFLQVREALRKLNGGVPPDPRYGSFHENLSAEQLVERQGVKPVTKAEELYGQGDPADWEGFDETVEQWRAEHPLT